MKHFALASFLLLLTTIVFVGKYKQECKINVSNSVKIESLLDSVEILNKDIKHLRKYFVVALRQDSVIKSCNICKKNEFIITD